MKNLVKKTRITQERKNEIINEIILKINKFNESGITDVKYIDLFLDGLTDIINVNFTEKEIIKYNLFIVWDVLENLFIFDNYLIKANEKTTKNKKEVVKKVKNTKPLVVVLEGEEEETYEMKKNKYNTIYDLMVATKNLFYFHGNDWHLGQDVLFIYTEMINKHFTEKEIEEYDLIPDGGIYFEDDYYDKYERYIKDKFGFEVVVKEYEKINKKRG